MKYDYVSYARVILSNAKPQQSHKLVYVNTHSCYAHYNFGIQAYRMGFPGAVIGKQRCRWGGKDGSLERASKGYRLSDSDPNYGYGICVVFARVFVEKIYPTTRIPETVLSDRDARFTSQFWEAVVKLFPMKGIMTTAFHSRGNGGIEGRHRIVNMAMTVFRCGDDALLNIT